MLLPPDCVAGPLGPLGFNFSQHSPTTRRSVGPLGPLGFNFSQHMPTTRPYVERTAEKAFLLSDRVSLSSAEAREEGIQGGSLRVFGGIPIGDHALPRTEPKSALMRLMVSHS